MNQTVHPKTLRRAAPPTGPWRRRFGLLAALFAASVLVAACGGGDSSRLAGGEATDTTFAASEDSDLATDGAVDATGEDTGGESQAAGDAEVAAPAAPAPVNELGAGGATVTPSAADLGRQLIFTANVEIGVDDVAGASARATEIVESRGGFLFGQNTTGGAEARSELTFKVLPADFNAVLDELGSVGELRNQTVSTDDVTERIVDLDSRIQVADLGVERLRAALANTANLADYAEVERLLLERESELEVMRGQLRTLRDRVDLATIVLVLTQDRLANNIEVAISTYEGHDEGRGCPGQGSFATPAGDALTVCFDITNLGDQTLTDVTVTDTVLGIEPGDDRLIEVFGGLDSVGPGQTSTVAIEIEPERDLVLRTRVTATPTDGVSPEAAGPAVTAQSSLQIQTFAPDRAPGFSDGFSAGRDVLSALWTTLTVALGFLLPLIVLAPLAWAAWQVLRRLRRRLPTPTGPTTGGGGGGGGGGATGRSIPTPPPPAPAPPPPGTGPETEPVPAGGDR